MVLGAEGLHFGPDGLAGGALREVDQVIAIIGALLVRDQLIVTRTLFGI